MRRRSGFSAGDIYRRYGSSYETILKNGGFESAPTWSPDVKHYAGKNRHQSFIMLLREIEMIDATSLTWEQIIALRNDPDHMKSLRDLRLYFEDNFQGQDASAIRDRLEQAVENQKITAKYWKLDTAKKTIAVAATKGNVALTSMATLAPVLAGAPLPIAAAAGALITVANCALEFRQVYVDAKNASVMRPFRFLTKLESAAEN